MGKVATEATLQQGVDLLGAIARKQINFFDDYDAIAEIVKKGLASKVFKIGDQIPSTWNDGTNDYELPWDVVDFRNVVNAEGETVPAMILQAHWALPGIMFDASEAAYVPAEAMPPGKYNISIGNDWGTHCKAGKIYTFSTTIEIPAGGQVVITREGNNQYNWQASDYAPTSWVVYTYVSADSKTPIEGPIALTEGAEGTSLGVLTTSEKYAEAGINNLQRAACGYVRYSHSAIRQWLNSDADVNKWWTAQNPFDRPPKQLASMRGFMAGLSADFLKIVNPIQITTALNTISDIDLGTAETITDTFFLPSLEEEYINPQAKNVEGPYFEYWKQRLALDAPQGWYADHTNVNHIRYLISDHALAQAVRLRSAVRGSACTAWYVTSSGTVNGSSAVGAYCPAPACAIC